MSSNQLPERTNRVIRNLKILLALEFIIILILLFVLFSKQYGFAPQKQRDAVVPDKTFGNCIREKPSTGDYIRLDINLKGTAVRISEFEFNGLDYASNPGCFRSANGMISMSNYISRNIQDSLMHFYISIRSRNYNDEYEFSLKVYDMEDKLIAKFPKETDAYKNKILNINRPFRIDTTINLRTSQVAVL